MKRAMTLGAAMILVTGAAWAQQGAGPQVDTAAAFSVRGSVVSFTAARGAGHPTLTVDDAARGEVSVSMAPLWFLEENGFSANPGDQVEAMVYPCSGCPVDGVAGRVDNLSLGTSVELRNEDGYPLWMGPGRRGSRSGALSGQMAGRRGGAAAAGAAGAQAGQCTGPDMSQTQTLQGTVVSFSGGPGQGLPTMVLEAGGEQHEIVVGPFRAVLASGLVLEPGRELTVTVAPSPLGHVVALAIADPATGATVQLRDPETGRPLMGRRHGRGMGPGRGAGQGVGPGSGDCPYAN